MGSKRRSNRKDETDIADYYAVNVKTLWKDFRGQHLSFWTLCIYFLFEYVRPQVLYPEFDVLPWAQIFLLLSLVAAFTDRTVHWVGNPLNKLFIAFFLIVILSGIFAFSIDRSWDYRGVMGGWIIVYFLVITVVNTEKRLVIFLLIYLLFNLKMAQHGAIGWAQRGFSFAGWGLVGAPGWFRNSGEYAIQMLIYGSLAIAFVVSLKDYWGRYKRIILYAAAATGFMAVMGASSRGAQIALVVIGIWILLKQKSGFRGVLAIIVVSAALYFILPEQQIDRIRDIGLDDDSLQRLAYWQYGIQVIKTHPLLGVGYNNWMLYVQYMVPEGMGPYGIIQEPHNIYIQAASELGITGLFVFLLMAIYAFINNARTRAIAKELDNKFIFNLTLGLDAGLIGFLAAGSFVTVLYYPFFWIQVAMIVMVHSVAKRQLSSKTVYKCSGNGE